MNHRCLGFFFLSSFLLVSPALSDSLAKKLAEIRESCSDIDFQTKSNALTPRFFAVLSTAQPESWSEYPSEAELQAACIKGFYRKATVYSKGPSIELVSLEAKSPSKEWVQYLKYYFSDDGSLEKIHSDFRRFGAYQRDKGDDQQFLVKVIRERVYGPNGKCIKKSSPRFFNTSTGGEVKDVVFKDEPWPVYPSTGKLPFYGLIQPPGTPAPAKQP